MDRDLRCTDGRRDQGHLPAAAIMAIRPPMEMGLAMLADRQRRRQHGRGRRKHDPHLPVLDASFDGATLNYLRWYSNDSAGPNEDTLVVDVSDDGGATWSIWRSSAPPAREPGWLVRRLLRGRRHSGHSTVRPVPGPIQRLGRRKRSGIEAGIDGISVVAISCVDESCQGDVDGNGTVGVEDLLAVIADWNCSSDCTADINGDLLVNVGDLLLVIGGWGNCNGG